MKLPLIIDFIFCLIWKILSNIKKKKKQIKRICVMLLYILPILIMQMIILHQLISVP